MTRKERVSAAADDVSATDAGVLHGHDDAASPDAAANGGAARQGFASLDPERQREIASLGGRAAHASGRAYLWSRDEAREAGKRGGAKVAADRSHMSRIGKLGGAARARQIQEERLRRERDEQIFSVSDRLPVADGEQRRETGVVDVPPAHDRHDGAFDGNG